MQTLHPLAIASNPACWAEISETIRLRLEGYGIRGPADWRRLSAHRKSSLFGITSEMRRRLNEISRGAL